MSKQITEQTLLNPEATRVTPGSAAFLREIVDAQMEMVCRFRADGTILFANKAYAASFGVSVKELEGRCLWDIIAEHDHPKVKAVLAQLSSAHPEASVEDNLVTAAGMRWVLWKNHALAFDAAGQWLEVQATGIDISDRKRAEAALSASEQRLRLALEAGQMGTWNWETASGHMIWSDQLFHLLGYTPGAVSASHEAWSLRVLPEDLPMAEGLLKRSIALGGDYRAEYRVFSSNDELRWLEARGRAEHDARGKAQRSYGVVMDITARKQQEDKQRLLIDELNHRVKNTLTIVQAIAQQSLKDTQVPLEVRRSFEARLSALATAHDTLTRTKWERFTLSDLLREVVEFCGSAGQRVLQSGPTIKLDPHQAVPIGMAIHELCTNAIKYGALANSNGSIALNWMLRSNPQRLEIIWREQGGPAVAQPQHRGFGTMMIERALSHQLQGQVDLCFNPTGVTCVITIPLLLEGRPQKGA